MDIKYKSITHERYEDAPFIGALVCADNCSFKCKGCFNKDLKKIESKIASAEYIINEIKSNPFNEGVIFGGLEWSEQPRELIALIEEATKQNLKIMIYTGCDFEEFHFRIGREFSGKLNIPEYYMNSRPMFSSIGANILNYYIKDTYYIKCGKYDKNDLATDREFEGVKLASNNQIIYKIKGEQNDREIIN